jgi:hypothetical protein
MKPDYDPALTHQRLEFLHVRGLVVDIDHLGLRHVHGGLAPCGRFLFAGMARSHGIV